MLTATNEKEYLGKYEGEFECPHGRWRKMAGDEMGKPKGGFLKHGCEEINVWHLPGRTVKRSYELLREVRENPAEAVEAVRAGSGLESSEVDGGEAGDGNVGQGSEEDWGLQLREEARKNEIAGSEVGEIPDEDGSEEIDVKDIPF